MIASISGIRYEAARTTLCGEPPTAIQVFRLPDSVLGQTSWSTRGGRVVPSQLTGSSSSSLLNRSSFSAKSTS